MLLYILSNNGAFYRKVYNVNKDCMIVKTNYIYAFSALFKSLIICALSLRIHFLNLIKNLYKLYDIIVVQ